MLIATDATGTPTSPDSIATILPSDLPAVTTLTSGVNAIAATVQTALTNNYLRKTSGNILNADINAGAAIAYSKLNLANSVVTGDIVNGTLLNADVNAAAGITYSKLALTGGIVDADISASAAITPNKLNAAICVAQRSSVGGTQSFAAADGVWTFDSTLVNTNTMWSAGSPTRITAPYTGYYRLEYFGIVSGAGAGSYGIFVRKNGTTNVAGTSLAQQSGTSGRTPPIISLTAADYVELIWTHGTSTGIATIVSTTVFITGDPFGYLGLEFLGS